MLPAADSCSHLKLEAFRFKDSIAEDMRLSDLIISHAGGYRYQMTGESCFGGVQIKSDALCIAQTIFIFWSNI